MKRVLAMMLVLVLALGTFAGCGGGGGSSGFGGSGKVYDSALKAYAKVLDGSLTEKDLERLYPEEYWDYLAEDEGVSRQELWEQMEPILSMIWLMLENTYGEGYRVTYKVTDEEAIDEDDDRWPTATGNGMELGEVSQAYAIEVEYTIKGSKKEASTSGEGVAFRYDGVWYATLEMEDMDELLGMEMEDGDVVTTPQDTPVAMEPQSSRKITETQCDELLYRYFQLISGKGDADDLMVLYPDDTWEYVEDELDADLEDVKRGFTVEAEEVTELLEDTFGRNVKFTYTIGDIELCDEDELEEIQDVCGSAGLKARKLTEACRVELELTVKGSADRKTYDTEAVFYLYDGDWYLKQVELDALYDDIDY